MKKTSLKKMLKRTKKHSKVALFDQSLKKEKKKTKSMKGLKMNGGKNVKHLTVSDVSFKTEKIDVPKGQIVHLTIRDSEGNISAINLHSGPCVLSITTGCILSTLNEPKNSDCCSESGRHDWGGEEFDDIVDKNMGWSIFGRK